MATSKAPKEGAGIPLSSGLTAALDAFCRHLEAERALSPHTVRAYRGDVQSLLEHAARSGVKAPGELDPTSLRGWLAGQHQAGAARATLARRGAAARAFTAFAYRQGWLSRDPGCSLASRRHARRCPGYCAGRR